MTKQLLWALAAVFLAVPAYSQMQTGSTTGKEAAPLDDKGLLERLHAANLHEIELAKLAQRKAMTSGAKSTAEMILRDHAQADAQLMALSKELKLTVAGKPQPRSEAERQHHALMDATDAYLKTVPSDQFDSVYLATMVAGHDHVISTLVRSKPKASPKLQGFVDQLLPTLQHHRDGAYRALGEIRAAEQGVGGAGKQE